MDNSLFIEKIATPVTSFPTSFADNWPYILMIVLTILDITLRAIALWKSARAGSKIWFIALMILNTLGLLPLIYILFFAPKSEKK